MTVYLDNNIFIYLENGSLALTDLENSIENKIHKIFYSASHIQETLEIKGENEIQRVNRIDQRLKTIERVTANNYLYHDQDDSFSELIESPYVVLETITQVPLAQQMMKGFSSFVSEPQKILIRETLNLDPQKINNYSPKEVVDHLSTKLSEHNPEFTFLHMIEMGISFHPDGKTFGKSHRTNGIFELLDMLGYWKDKATDKSNYARLWDASHTFHASYCDYFVTDDKRTLNKAKVVYDIFNIKTKIITSKIKNIV